MSAPIEGSGEATAGMGSEAWFYEVNGQQHGPVTGEVLHRLYAEARITRDTLVWREGLPNWVAYRETGFAEAPAPSGPPPLATGRVGDGWVIVSMLWPLLAAFLGAAVAAQMLEDSPALYSDPGALGRRVASMWWLGYAVNAALGGMDWRALRNARQPRPSPWWALLPPAYLVLRARRQQRSPASGVIWGGLFIVMLLTVNNLRV